MGSIRVNVPGLKKLKVVPYTTTELVYDGTVKTPVWQDFDSTAYKITGETSATTAGTHYMELVPTGKWVWSDGTRKKKLIPFVIKKQPVTVPTVSDTSKTFNRFSQSPTISSYNTNLISVTGNSGTDVGDYKVIMSLKDTANYCWADVADCWSENAISNREKNWRINILYLAKPTAPKTEIPYSFGYQNLPVNNYNSNYMRRTGTAGATELNALTDIESYEVTYSLYSKTNTKWVGGSTDDVVISWKIVKAVLTVPTVAWNPTYTGYSQQPGWNNYNSYAMTIGGDYEGTEAGSYRASFSIDDTTRSCWEDGSTGTKYVTWRIYAMAVSDPPVWVNSDGYIAEFTYDGEEHSPTDFTGDAYVERVETGEDSSSVTEATDVKTYRLKFKLVDKKNTTWEDGSTSTKVYSWRIWKRDVVLIGLSSPLWASSQHTTSFLSFSISQSEIDRGVSRSEKFYFRIDYFDGNYSSGNLPTITVVNNKTDYPNVTYSISKFNYNSNDEVGCITVNASSQIYSYTNNIVVKFPGSNNLKSSSNKITIQVKYNRDTDF